MKKLLVYFSLLIPIAIVIIPSFCHAQDTLVLRNGQKMTVKVISVADEIIYSIPPDNKLMFIKSSKVNGIKYKDGTTYSLIPKVGFQKKYSITTDFAQYLLLSPNIGFEYNIIRPISMGINFSWVTPSPAFEVNPLADGQYTHPGAVYSGYAVRLYIKAFPNPAGKSYWCLQGVFKSLSINGASFYDQFGDTYSSTYNINEKATTWGIDLLHGNELTRAKGVLAIDLFYGLGLHVRNRKYTVYNQEFGNFGPPITDQGAPVVYDGNYTGVLDIFTPVIGLRMGFNYIKRK